MKIVDMFYNFLTILWLFLFIFMIQIHGIETSRITHSTQFLLQMAGQISRPLPTLLPSPIIMILTSKAAHISRLIFKSFTDECIPF